jgi:formyltetrahydrofolate synthetase
LNDVVAMRLTAGAALVLKVRRNIMAVAGLPREPASSPIRVDGKELAVALL